MNQHYQDTWKRGKVVETGERECEARYLAIKPYLEQYDRPFTVLDIGANLGYFTFRIAEDFPSAVVVAVEQNEEPLLSLCQENDLGNVIFLNHKLSLEDIQILAQCEVIDVVLALNVFHHFDIKVDEVNELFQSVLDLSLLDTFIELPTPEDTKARGQHKADKLIEPIYSILIGGTHVKESIGWFDSHVTAGAKRPLYRISKLLFGELVKPFCPFFDSADKINLTVDKTSWIEGINLRTYQLLGGCYPSRGKIGNYIRIINTRRYENGEPAHGDIRPWNFIISGNKLSLIDGNDERAIYNDEESFDALITDMQWPSNVPMSVDEWSNVGKRTLAVLTPARNAAKHLNRYFDQLVELRELIHPMQLRLVVAEGDSVDGTPNKLLEKCTDLNIDYTHVDTTHGKRYWRSVEDPDRLATMSNIMNAALDQVRETDSVVLWVMVDVKYDPGLLNKLVGSSGLDMTLIMAPLALMEDGRFWDTWAFRQNGDRFNAEFPYCEFSSIPSMPTFIDSAGTCLIIPTELARKYRADELEAVDFCNNARADGHCVITHPEWKVYHQPESNKRLLLLSDIDFTTGLGKTATYLLPKLAQAGYEIEIIGINTDGEPIWASLPYKVWPAAVRGQHHKGELRLAGLIEHNPKYDVFLTITDPVDASVYMSIIEQAVEAGKAEKPDRCVCWLTVDSTNQQAGRLKGYDQIITCSEFGEVEIGDIFLEKSPIITPTTIFNISTIPLGVDSSIYFPDDKARSEFLVESLQDKFIVGFIGKNQFRKRLDVLLDVYQRFIDRIEEDEKDGVRLLIQTYTPHPSNFTYDLESLIEFYKLEDLVLVSDTANTRDVPEQYMAKFYNSLDVLISTSLGEGFCLPVLEAMACGVPVIVPQHSGYCWSKGYSVEIPVTNACVMSPLNISAYQLGWEIDRSEAAKLLYEAYKDRNHAKEVGLKGIELANKLSWDSATDKVVELIDQLEVVESEPENQLVKV